MRKQYKFTMAEIGKLIGSHLQDIGEIEDGNYSLEWSFEHSMDGRTINIDAITVSISRTKGKAPVIKLVR